MISELLPCSVNDATQWYYNLLYHRFYIPFLSSHHILKIIVINAKCSKANSILCFAVNKYIYVQVKTSSHIILKRRLSLVKMVVEIHLFLQVGK